MSSVALIAIAKDEDTYIHEWIHHHLYLGFSPILIGVNRTSDKTHEIINKISKTEKRVKAYCIDWIDQGQIGLNINIQKLGYAYLSSKIDQSNIDYVGFLDIDEFWFNVDEKRIQDFIQEKKPFDIATFFWLCQLGEDTAFTPPFKDVHYEIRGPVKSIIHSSLLNKVEIFTPHVPSFKSKHYQKLIHIDQKGNTISGLNDSNQYNIQKPSIDKTSISSCILHRMMRSEQEYLSLVLRGRPNGKLIKSNGRKGFKKAEIPLPLIFDKNYYIALKHFNETHKLENILKTRRAIKLASFKHSIECMNANQLTNEMDNAITALRDTAGMKYFVDEFIKKVSDIETLIQFAIKLENIYIILSLQLMKKALELEPSGLLIISKIGQYQIKIDNKRNNNE